MYDTLTQATSADLHDFATLTPAEIGRRGEKMDAWGASGMHCPKAQALERLGHQGRVRSPSDIRRMAAGSRVHDFTLRQFQTLGTVHLPPEWCVACDRPMEAHHDPDEWHLYSEARGISTSLDLLIHNWEEPGYDPWLRSLRDRGLSRFGNVGPLAVEVKSVEANALYYLSKGVLVTWKRQLGTMMLLHSEDPTLLPVVPERWEILVVPMDKSVKGEFPSAVAVPAQEAWMDEAAAYIERRHTAWTAGDLPACECAPPFNHYYSKLGRQTGFCPFSTGSQDCCEVAS